MKKELERLIQHLERLQESMESIKEMQTRIDKLEQFKDYLKGMFAAAAVIAAGYGVLLIELIKRVF